MKILHVIDSGGLYGAEMVLLALAEEQKLMGHNPCIASIGEPGEYEKPLEEEARRRDLDVAVFRMANGPNILGALRIVGFACANGFDILHSHGYKGDILLGLLPRSVRRFPLVCTVHGWTSIGSFGKMRLYEWADALCLRRADAVCLVSEAMLGLKPIAAIDRKKVYVIPNGISRLDNSLPLPEDEITNFCKQGFTVVSIGRLSPEKGYDVLIRAFSLLHQKQPNTRLLIIGEGPCRQGLEDLTYELGLEDRVFLPGYRSQAWRYLSACKIFVLSSITEGLPVTLLEAIQTGIPIVATKVGGIPWVLNESKSGTMVLPGDHVELAQALERIIEQKQVPTRSYIRMGMKAEYSFLSSIMAQGYDVLYNKLTSMA